MKSLVCLRTHGVGLSQSFTASFGHSDILELPFRDQFVERPGRFLDRNTAVDSGRFEQVQVLGSPEVLVNVVNTAPQVFLATNPLSYNSEEVEG